MSCLDHDLSDHELEQLKEHADSCEQCRELLGDLRGITHALESAPQLDPPENVEVLVMSRVMQFSEPAAEKGDNLLKAVYGTLALVGLLLFWAVSAGLQGFGVMDVLLQGIRSLFIFVEEAWNYQVAYHLVSSIFSQGIDSLITTLQAVYVLAGLGSIVAGIKKLQQGPGLTHTKVRC